MNFQLLEFYNLSVRTAKFPPRFGDWSNWPLNPEMFQFSLCHKAAQGTTSPSYFLPQHPRPASVPSFHHVKPAPGTAQQDRWRPPVTQAAKIWNDPPFRCLYWHRKRPKRSEAGPPLQVPGNKKINGKWKSMKPNTKHFFHWMPACATYHMRKSYLMK